MHVLVFPTPIQVAVLDDRPLDFLEQGLVYLPGAVGAIFLSGSGVFFGAARRAFKHSDFLSNSPFCPWENYE
jgi:hypothetical protein